MTGVSGLLVADTDLLRSHALQVSGHAAEAAEIATAAQAASAPVDAFGMLCALVGQALQPLQQAGAVACSAIGPCLDVTAAGVWAAADALDVADAGAAGAALTLEVGVDAVPDIVLGATSTGLGEFGAHALGLAFDVAEAVAPDESVGIADPPVVGPFDLPERILERLGG